MSAELKHDLAMAKQHYEELMSLTTLEHLFDREYGQGPKRERIRELVDKLMTLQKRAEDTLAAHLDKAGDVPIMHIDSGLRDFYAEVLEPNAIRLRDVHLDITGLTELLDVNGWEELCEKLHASNVKTPIANAVQWGVERWWDGLSDEELQSWVEDGFNIDAAMEFVKNGFFAPDSWLENQRLLRPVLVDRPLHTLPTHVQYRLSEIYRSFVHGFWMSAIALSRSVAEYAIIDNGARLGLDICYDYKGKKAYKRFELLIDGVAEKYPDLRDPLETVRTTGNRILHPRKKRDVEVISFPKVMRDEALGCIKGTRLVVERLYSIEGIRSLGKKDSCPSRLPGNI